MPYSDGSNRPAVLQFLVSEYFKPASVLDVGAGGGSNLDFYGPWWPKAEWTALEVWKPYIGRFSLLQRYKGRLVMGDVRQVKNFNYDLVIFGDILEHLPKSEALEVLDRALAQSKYVVVSLPIIHWPQGHVDGNPYEEHVSEWSQDDFEHLPECVASLSLGTGTGAFVLKGRNW